MDGVTVARGWQLCQAECGAVGSANEAEELEQRLIPAPAGTRQVQKDSKNNSAPLAGVSEMTDANAMYRRFAGIGYNQRTLIWVPGPEGDPSGGALPSTWAHDFNVACWLHTS